MLTAARAWTDFSRAIADAADSAISAAPAHRTSVLLRNTRELLDIVDEEINAGVVISRH
jgi:hypothetical protein